jgi:hypothetical protein
MRKLITFCAALLVATFAFGQKPMVTSDMEQSHKALPESRYLEVMQNARPNTGTANGAFGSLSGSAVTAVKVGEASNAFTSLVNETNQVYSIPEANAIAFLNRQNIQDCGGQTIDNGRYRYSISIDGGATWNIGGNGGTYVPPSFNGCYGIGVVNPAYTRPSRYPNMNIFLRGNVNDADSIALVYSGPVLQPSASGWDGSIVGTVLNAADTMNMITVSQEAYVQQAGNQYFNYSMVAQWDSRNSETNFWYGARSWDGTNVGTTFLLNKGTYNQATKEVDWSLAETINLPYFTGFDGNERAANFTIAFSPDGQHGWIGMVGDLVGGEDTVYQPIFIHSDDYGDTWGAPEEVNTNAFPELRDTLFAGSLVTFVDSAGNPVDTLPFLTGKSTTGFDCDLEVDNNGDPHMLVVVAGASTLNTPEAGYSIFSGLGMYLFDVTRDQFGDWNMLYIDRQATFRGEFGDVATGGSSSFTSDPYLQVTRSEDGTKIFYSWTDSDTTGIGGNDNNQPDLLGRAWDKTANKLTDVVNWTSNDLDWATRAVLPKTANAAIKNGTVFNVPTVVISLDNSDAIQPVSFWYFQDIDYDTDNDFNSDPDFFYNCKENPFANMSSVTPASCAMNNDGAVSITGAGGLSPYTFQWATGNATDTLNVLTGLAAGVYTGFVTDSKGCVDTLTAIVSNVGAPSATITAATVTNPSCFGSTDGAATVVAAGGSGGTTFAWNTSGEMTAAASMLPAGQSIVTVTDNAGCSSFAVVNLTQPPAINISTTGEDVLCNGDGNGSATVTLATGGAGGFSFQWDDAAMTMGTSLTGVGGGTYTVTVTDMNGCTETSTVTVVEPAPLTATTSSTDPTACLPATFDGTASATASGGTAPFTYDWTLMSNGSSAGSGSFIFGLDCGYYSVTITDDNGCSSTVDSILVGQVLSIEDELSAGISTWKLFPNPTQNNVNVEIVLATADQMSLQIIDLKGRTIVNHSFNYGLNVNESINLNDVPAGIYLVKLNTSQGSASRKLVVK